MIELLHPVLFLLILAAIGVTAHRGLARARQRFDETNRRGREGGQP